MRIGVMIGPERGRYASKVDRMRRDARWAEEAGMSSVWVPQIPDEFDALTAVAIIASETSRIEIGTAVVPVQPRHPIALAQQALSVQAVCQGRLTLGLGVSHDWIIDDMLGLPYEHPAATMRAYLDVLDQALIGPGSVDVENELFRIHNPLDITDVSPTPMLLAALGPMMLKLAGERTDGTLLWLADERAIGTHVAPTLTRAAEAAGRPAPRIVAGIPVCLCGEDEVDVAIARTNRILSEAEVSPNYQRLLDLGDANDVGDILAAGSESSVEKRLRSFSDAGVTDISVRVVPIGDDRDQLLASMNRTRDYLASLAGGRSDMPHLEETRMAHRTLDIPLFDADNHLYETRDSLTKFLPDRYKTAIQYVEVDGRTKILVKGQVSEYIPNPTFDIVAAPGAMEDYFRKGNPDGLSRREIFGKPIRSIDAFREPEPRLRLMDEQGIDRALMFPTLASLIEERLRHHPEVTHAVVHALNEWLHETWSFNYEDRIFPTPVITLPIVDKAIEELEWVVDRGARAVLIRPAPAWGVRGPRSFGLPEFDPFWEKVVEADVLVAMHSSDSGYERYVSDWLGSEREYLPFQPDPFGMISLWRPVEDAVSTLVCHGALSRFPSLKVAVIENGSSWVEPLLKTLADLYKKMPQDFPEDPIEVIRRNIYISPFWEEDLGALAELVGTEHVLFGSDFPHPEGLADPVSYVDELAGLPEDSIRKIMGGNLAALMGVDDRILR